MIEQLMRQGIHIPAGDGIGKQQLQRLMGLKTHETGPGKPRLQPFPVPCMLQTLTRLSRCTSASIA